MWSGLSVVFFLAAELLVWSGAAKLLRPEPSLDFLRVARLPSRRPAARTLGAVELAVGAACLLAPTPTSAALLAALYVGFAAVLAAALTGVVAVSSCGCFGAKETPPSRLHLATNVLGAAAGVALTVGPRLRGLLGVAASTPFRGLPVVVGLAAAGWLTVLAMTTLPELAHSHGRSGTAR